VGVLLGAGTYKNDAFNRDLTANGFGAIKNGVEYGFGVDYRFSRWFSVGFEVGRVGGDAAQPMVAPASGPTQYSATASPFAINLTAHVAREPRGNLDVFVGGGPLLSATVSSVSDIFDLSASKTGVYLHAGAAAELRFSPMVALGVRGLVRHARASRIDLRDISNDPNAIWDLDFSGVAFSIGPKIYLGNVE
jgi:hypothetical protein